MREIGKCMACGSTKELQLDHIVPLADGGLDELENTQLLCWPHHKAKTIADAKARRKRALNESLKGLVGTGRNPEKSYSI